MDKKIFSFEIVGAIFAIISGSLLHFTYKWSNYNVLMATIAAVNESAWEHLKLGFWPLLFWAILEYFIFGKRLKNFCFAKFITLAVFCLSVPIMFYSYTSVLGANYLPFDISIFIIGIVLGQFIGYKIMNNKKDLRLGKISTVLILLMIIAFSSFSFITPRNFLFKDPITGAYGITENQAGNNQTINNQIDRNHCLADDCLVVDNLTYPAGQLPPEVKTALDEAINDESKALSTYGIY